MLNPGLKILFVFLVALFASLFVLPKLARIAKVIGLTDKPSEKRKVHKIPRPLVGGIGMVISTTFSSLILIPISGLRGYFLGLSILLLIGFFDDFKELGHNQKFLAQIAATCMLIYFSEVSLVTFGDLLGFGIINIPDIPWLIWGMTIFCVVGVINSLNLIDGIDGLAGGISFVAFITFAIHSSIAGAHTLMLLNLALAGAVLGFLRYNWYPSIMFMGDAGSLCLGFSLAFMALALTQGSNAQIVSPVCPLLVLAVPITDTLIVMGKRLLRGYSPFKPDRYHLHHIFMRYGMGRTQTVKAIIGITLILCGISLLGPIYKVPDVYLFAVFLCYFSLYLIASFFIVFTMKLSLKYKKKTSGNYLLLCLQRLLAGKIVFFNVSRSSPRFDVDLAFICRENERHLVFSGKILNLSRDGFMASVPQLDSLLDRVVVKIAFPFDSKLNSLDIPAEHLWVTQNGKKYYHGFRFIGISDEQEEIISRFCQIQETESDHENVTD